MVSKNRRGIASVLILVMLVSMISVNIGTIALGEPADKSLTEAIIDVATDGYKETGSWTEHGSLLCHDGTGAPKSRYSTETDATAFFPFPAELPAGEYEVYYYLTNANTYQGILVNGTEQEAFQGKPDGVDRTVGWYKIGEFDFNAGTDQGVTIKRQSSGGYARATSIKYISTAVSSPESSTKPSEEPSTVPSPDANSKIVDVEDPGFVKTGTWQRHTSMPAHDGLNAPQSWYSNEDNATAFFPFPKDMGAGKYEVSYYMPHTNTSQIILVNDKQEAFEGASKEVGWNVIGEYDFTAEDGQGVTVKRKVGGGYARATAIKYTRIIEEPDDPSKYPVASNVTLTGGKATGDELTASYTFTDPQGHAEQNSVYRFYSADSQDSDDWKVIASGTTTAEKGAKYTLKMTDAKKYIKFEITPKCEHRYNNTGNAQTSAVFGPTDESSYAGPEIFTLTVTGEAVASKSLSVNYGYRDDAGIPEGESTFEWLRSTDESGTDWEVVRSGITDMSKIIDEDYIFGYSDIGKCIKIRITPKNTNGVSGQSVESQVFGPVTMVGDTLIIDNLEVGYTDSDNGSGQWGTNDYTDTSYQKTHRWTNVADEWAKFEPPLIKPGKYKVYYWIPMNHPGSDKEMQIEVKSEEGVTQPLKIDLTAQEAGTWFEIGDYTFMPNSGHYVKSICSGNGYLRSDAVKFELIEKKPVAPFATDATIEGAFAPGRDLNGDYLYTDYFGTPEGSSEYIWQSSDSAAFSNPAVIGTERNYTIKDSDVGKYIRFGVKVRNNENMAASEYIYSEPTIAIPDSEYAPEVSGVSITGEKIAGAILTGSYHYSDKNMDPEGESKYAFFEVDANGNKIKEVKSGTCKQGSEIVYQTGDEDVGKYYILEIVPVGTHEPTEGKAVTSSIFGPVVVSTIKPVAQNVKISTMIATGSPAEVKYTYYHALKQAEGETTFQWYIGDSAVGEFTAIPGATGTSYTPTAEQQFKYILCEVTPVSVSAPKIGEPVRSAPVYIKWQTEFADEFNYEAADGNDPYFSTIWTSDNGPKPHILSGRYPENLKVTNGKLYVLNKKEQRNGQDWTSGSMTSNEDYFYGYYEASYKYAAATGLNQSFWIMSRGSYTQGNGTHEIDINEGHYPNSVNCGNHWYDENMQHQSSRFRPKYDIDFSKDFHTFGLDWNEQTLDYYLDGEMIWSIPNTFAHQAAPIWFSLAVSQWAGDVTDAIDGTAAEVEYIRHFTEPENKPAVDKEALNASAYEAKSIIDGYNNQTAFYPKAEIDKLQAILDEISIVVNNANATQSEVDAAKSRIDAAIEHIKTTALGDKRVLIERTELAKNELNVTQEGNKFGQYTTASRQELQRAINEAEKLINSDGGNQTEVDAAVNKINSAIRAYQASIVTVCTVGADDSDIVIPAELNKDVTLTFPENVGKTVTIPAGAPLNINITLNLQNNGKDINLQFQKGLQIGGEAGGTLAIDVPADRSVSASDVLSGFDMSKLNITESAIKGAVRVSFSREENAKIGIFDNGTIHAVATNLSVDNLENANNAVSSGSELAMSYGLTVWSKNFDAEYVVYQESNNNNNDNDNNNNNNSDNNNNWTPGIPGVVIPPNNNNNNGTDDVKFTDITGHWAESEIKDLAGIGIINGRTEYIFAPEDQVTRAEFAALIRRTIGLSEQEYTGGFVDINGNEWYAREIAAIVESGIMSGADGMFRPEDVITREEMAKVIVNAYYVYTGNSIDDIAVIFDDSSDISGWAVDYVSKAVAAGLMNGVGEEKFSPKSNATRAQAAAVISRLLQA